MTAEILQFPGNFRKSEQHTSELSLAQIALEGGPILTPIDFAKLYEPITEPFNPLPCDCGV